VRVNSICLRDQILFGGEVNEDGELPQRGRLSTTFPHLDSPLRTSIRTYFHCVTFRISIA
jgi:hypothetical protein